MKKYFYPIIVLVIIIIIGVLIYRSRSMESNSAAILDPVVVAPADPVAENPEGEADPSVMKLTMTDWNYVRGTVDGKNLTLPDGKFGLTFRDDGSFSAKTDCNNAGGSYTSTKTALELGETFSTMMYCEGSRETEFLGLLNRVATYEFTNRGELILTLEKGNTITLR